MKFQHWLFIFLLALLASCSTPPTVATTPSLAPTRTLGQPGVGTTPVPDAGAVASAFLDAWKADDYEAMYALITPLSQDAMSQESFVKHYRGIATEMALSGIDYEILSSL